MPCVHTRTRLSICVIVVITKCDNLTKLLVILIQIFIPPATDGQTLAKSTAKAGK